VILLDTHALVWLVADPKRLSRAGVRAIERADPADRLIVATALVHAVPLVTRDERIRASRSCRTIW
jgi:PIN domain nuclease of toxin-antitoxin system